MDRYIYGSSAYKIEDDIYTGSDYAREEEIKKAERHRAKLRSQFRMKIFLIGFIVLCLAAGEVYSRVLIMEAQSAVQTKENELKKLIEENNKKKIEYEQSIDLKKVQELAISKYGMQRPAENQIVSVNVVQKDYGEVLVK